MGTHLTTVREPRRRYGRRGDRVSTGGGYTGVGGWTSGAA